MWRSETIISRIGWIIVAAALVDWHVLAQHAGHGERLPQDLAGMAAMTETRPADDAVLARAPNVLELDFPERVRLVKLTLHSARMDWIDISFRYDPKPSERFTWVLPELGTAAFYLADWAALSVDERLIRGSFRFAFGPDAEPPSVTLAEQAMGLPSADGGSTSRIVSPPPSRIILDQDPPDYDPPFTIDLRANEPD